MIRAAMSRLPAGKVAIGLLVAGVILLVAAANWHLVHVAIRSQPECVAHVRPGEAAGGDQRFSAAASACRPDPVADRRK